MKALVFGALTHIGFHVAAELIGAGHDVSAVDFADAEAYEEHPDFGPDVAFCALDPLAEDAAALDLCFDPTAFDVVYFCAADGYGEDQPEPWTERELSLERALLERFAVAGTKAIVLTSSAAVYDAAAARALGAAVTETAQIAPANALGAHSLALEHGLLERAEALGIQAVALRCSIVVGVGRRMGSAHRRRAAKLGHLIPGLTPSAVEYPSVSFALDAGGGGVGYPHLRDFVHVTDVATAHRLCGEALAAGTGLAVAYNVGSGCALGPRAAFESLGGIDTVKIDVGTPAWPDASAGPALDCGRARADLDWAAQASPDDFAQSEVLHVRAVALAASRIGPEIRVGFEFAGSTLTRAGFNLYGLLLVVDKTGELQNRDLQFEVSGRRYTGRLVTRRGLRVPFKSVRVSPMRLTIPAAELADLPLHSAVRALYLRPDGRWLRRRLRYSTVLRKEPTHRRGRLHRLRETDSVIYVRQALRNFLSVSTRGRAATDAFAEATKIALAKFASLLWRSDRVLLYEKQGSQYEESASVLFEELVDRGRRDVRFVLAAEMIGKVPERYRGQVVRRLSLRHYYHFFCTPTFIGTETVHSAAEIRTANRMLVRRIFGKRYRFVFLQHGVMYMVSLNAGSRGFFRAGSLFPEGTKIVVSSEREAMHFIDLGHFPAEDLYVSGLPKFDRAHRLPDADRILVMPTWRPWEHNVVRIDPENAPYTLMLREILSAVPHDLRDKVRILPHPLIRPFLLESDLAPSMYEGDSYEEALRQCALLITDYSSIAYDAFYRGANVAFWWKEKDECMAHYGGHLMLEEETAYGPVCYDTAQLSAAVAGLYGSPQSEEYVRRYREIVTFHDNRNTERLLGFLERDGLL